MLANKHCHVDKYKLNPQHDRTSVLAHAQDPALPAMSEQNCCWWEEGAQLPQPQLKLLS